MAKAFTGFRFLIILPMTVMLTVPVMLVMAVVLMVAVMLTPVMVTPLGQLLMASIQLTVKRIKFPVHTIAVTVDLVALAVELLTPFIRYTSNFIMIVVMPALPLINLPVALVQLTHIRIKLPMHTLPVTVKRLSLPLYLLTWVVIAVAVMFAAVARCVILEIITCLHLCGQRGATNKQQFEYLTFHNISLTSTDDDGVRLNLGS